MNKALFALVAAVLLLLAAVVGWTLLTPPSHILAGSPVADGSLRYTQSAQYYDITIAYPARTPLYHWWDPRADTLARLSMESWLQDDSAQFVQDLGLDQMSQADLQSEQQNGERYAYDARYKQYISASGALASYEYDIYVDTGGAHPNGYFKTFVFNSSGKEIALADLFVAGSDYLQRLASSSAPQVESQIGQRLGLTSQSDIEGALFMDGLTPTQDNFQDFVIDGTDLVLLFPPYQVAPYAAGDFEIRIPLAQLSDILQPEWK